MKFEDHQEEIIYVNAIFRNTTTTRQPIFSNNFTTNFLDSSGNYSMAIVRFNIPNSGPYFEFKNDSYKVTLEHNNVQYQSTVQYINKNNDSSQNVYSVRYFLEMINNALEASFTALDIAFPGTVTEAPFLVFNSSTGLMSLYIGQDYESNVKLYFNNALYQYFINSFDVIYNKQLLDREYEFEIRDYKNNIPVSPANYYEFVQETSSIYNWYDIQRVIFSTGTLPVRSEYFMTQSSDGISIQKNIVTDFSPLLSLDKSNFIYEPSIYRMINLRGHSYLNSFDLYVSYSDKDGNTSPYYLEPGELATVKVGFFKKPRDIEYI